MADLNTLTATFDRVESELKATLEQQSVQMREQGASNAETAKAVKEASDRLSELGQEIVAAQAKITELENLQARGGSLGEQPKSIGAQFAESDQYQAMRKARANKS